MDSERGCPRVEAARSSSAAAREAASASRPETRPCNAVTGSPGRRTSTPSTDGAARRRAAISCCTGSRATRTPTASRDSVSRCRGPSGRPSSAQPREAAAARGVARAPARRCLAGTRLRPRGAPGSRRAGGDAREGLARRRDRRGAREGAAREVRRASASSMRGAGRSACSRRPGRASTTRAARSTRSTRSGSSGSSAGAVLACWRVLRCNPWSHGGVDYAKDQTLFPLGGSRRART